jgi:hypothetical protein
MKCAVRTHDVYIYVRTGILAVFCVQVLSQSCRYGYARQVTVIDENVLVIEQSKGKYASLDIAASTFTDNIDILGTTSISGCYLAENFKFVVRKLSDIMTYSCPSLLKRRRMSK